MRLTFILLSCLFFSTVKTSFSFEISSTSRQLILGISKNWDDSEATLQRWERRGPEWKRVGSDWKARLGKNGLAWGRGLHPESALGPQKQEGDGRAPAGVFKLGNAYGYASKIRKHPKLHYHHITVSALLLEDVSSKHYNRHLQLDGRGPLTEWEHEQQMRLNDQAHSLKLFIGHNAPPETVPGAGSAIFFHIWRRNGDAPTSGCTTMREKVLRQLIEWVDPNLYPVYTLLPEDVYRSVRESWRLP
ncbi:MAG: L,D-transpeptidase family protein [Verrucomicrobiota bacterium]